MRRGNQAITGAVPVDPSDLRMDLFILDPDQFDAGSKNVTRPGMRGAEMVTRIDDRCLVARPPSMAYLFALLITPDGMIHPLDPWIGGDWSRW